LLMSDHFPRAGKKAPKKGSQHRITYGGRGGRHSRKSMLSCEGEGEGNPGPRGGRKEKMGKRPGLPKGKGFLVTRKKKS